MYFRTSRTREFRYTLPGTGGWWRELMMTTDMVKVEFYLEYLIVRHICECTTQWIETGGSDSRSCGCVGSCLVLVVFPM